MKQLLSCLASLLIINGISSLPVYANAATEPAKAAPKKTKKVVKTPVKEIEEPEPEIQQMKSFEYKCELGNSLTMYVNQEDPQHIAMRWKKKLYRLSNVETTTGAKRYENKKSGFVWIGIPAKGLLLDSHKGQQLANECKTNEPMLADAIAETPNASQN